MSAAVALQDAALEDAARAQSLASDPCASAFVSASAGSGKTKLLIDRLLRLMLPGPDRAPTPPERILCLTFTKAGAAEMAIRLRDRLARWVAMEDAALDRDLASLGLVPGAALRETARALFARVLDTGAGMGGGGIRIGTIHAFCEQLLRRFPLEARISPHFDLLEEADGVAALEAAREAPVTLEEHARAVTLLAARIAARDHGQLTRALQARADRLGHAHGLDPEALAASLREALAITAADLAELEARTETGLDRDALGAMFKTLAAEGPAGASAAARELLALLEHFDAARWRDHFFTATGTQRSLLRSNAKLAQARPGLLQPADAEYARLRAIEDERCALAILEATAALLALSGPALAAYAARKEATGLLDFDDLIGRTERLLADPGVAWVLFKLDGGLDHLLLDEVQDTSAAQWKIAGKLTEEFFTGASANPNPRTVFAVGDFKQSIFSFQGADPESFRAWNAVFRDRVRRAGGEFREPLLNVSFRSAPAILRFVDAVFADERARHGVVAPGTTLEHRSARPELAGRIELWPLACADVDAAPAAADASAAAAAPTPSRGGMNGVMRLATSLADHLAGLIAGGELRPRDILVLVRRRGDFASALISALKARDVPVAGLDRMVLATQPAVADMRAFCEALLLPDDDLAFATFLVSPLGGLDDEDLAALAIGRRGTLREALHARRSEKPAWEAADRFFAERFRRADFASPHALLSETLGAGGGRARFLARFGPEAGEALDELLAAALAHGGAEVPSLQGFVAWLGAAGAEIKRQPGEAADEVRLMTVHGSKGLEAPMVVLADTTSLPRPAGNLLWTGEAGAALPLWIPAGVGCPASLAPLREAAWRDTLAEYDRLLYVGLTRARTRLLVCGVAPTRGKLPPDSWYAVCRRALLAMPGTEEVPWHEAGVWEEGGLAIHGDDAPARPAAHPTPTAAPPEGAAPAWLGRPPPPEPTPRRPLAPSRPEGIEWGPAPAAASPRTPAGSAASRARGTVLHALLQHVGDLDPARRAEAAHRFARARLGEDDGARLADEALAVIADPRLARVFGPGASAEQRLGARIGGLVVSGIVDRIAIGPDGIDLVDFKSGRRPPAQVADTPVAYLRQMAAYRAVLQALRPGLPVRCALVWTADPRVVPLPDDLLDAHAPAARSGSA